MRILQMNGIRKSLLSLAWICSYLVTASAQETTQLEAWSFPSVVEGQHSFNSADFPDSILVIDF